MRRYETIFIMDPDLTDESRGPVVERVKGLIDDLGGFLVKTDEWGIRKLAYNVKKRSRGYYTLLDYCGNGPLVDEMERFFRIDDRVLKFMTVLQAEDVDVEKLKEEIARAETEQQPVEAPETDPTAQEPETQEPAPEAVEAETGEEPSQQTDTTEKQED